jgi:hypothetical protein
MCTDISNSKFPRISIFPVVCYKVLTFRDEGIFETPFEECEIQFNKVIKAEGKTRKGETELGSGFIHAFVNVNSAYDLVERLTRNHYVVVKCYIPLFTRYYKGIDTNTLTNGYATKKIIYNEILYEIDTRL